MPRKSKGGRSRHLKPAELPERFVPGCVHALDQRTALAQRLRDNFVVIVEETGGESELSHVKAALIERFIHLEALLVQLEAQLKQPSASSEIIGKWIQGTNALQGLAKVLGINRKLRDPWAAIQNAQPSVPSVSDASQPAEAAT